MVTAIEKVEVKEEKALTRITNYMESAVVKARFAQIMGERGASNYIASVLIAVADSWALQKCTPISIYTNALRAATLRLSVDPGVGQAYLVPFGEKATLIVGYKGLHDMAVRTNRYRYINVSQIYEGQEITQDQITGFHKIGGGRTGNRIIGWIGAFEMLARFGGYSKTLYMTVEEIHEHGQKYSKSYSKKDSPWQTEPDKMERKTVLRLLLRRWGYIDPADVKELEEMEVEGETIDAQFETLTETMNKQAAPEIKNSSAANISILTGEGNPDPIKDATWEAWESWKARAAKVGIVVSEVNRAGTAEQDLQAYIREVSVYILDAERQAAA
jgi:recombination protein RecT